MVISTSNSAILDLLRTCNEWSQFSNPVYESIIRDFKPVKIIFWSNEADNFNGIGMSERSKGNNLIDDVPFSGNWFFSIGTLRAHEEKIPGPHPHLVEKVELYVNPGEFSSNNCQNIYRWMVVY